VPLTKKNIGEQYCINLAERLNVSPGKHSIKYSEKVDCFSSKRYAKSITRAAKLKRLSLKKRKSELKNKNEAIEGITYESHIGLLSAVPELMQTTMINDNIEPICVFFDLETGGFSKTCDIIQLAAKHEKHEFSVYVRPSQKITEEASQIHGLRVSDGQLKLHGKPVITVTLLEALIAFYEFLCCLKRKCILCAHNCSFDYTRLIRAIDKVFMKDHYKTIVYGFCDTLPIIKKITGKKSKGSNKLENLAKELNISCDK